MPHSPFILKVRVISAKDLPAADPTGESDPYVVLVLDGKILGRTSTVIQNRKTPKWNYESREIPLMHLHQSLEFKIFDRDQKKNDDYLGLLSIPLSEIEPNGTFIEINSSKIQGIHKYDCNKSSIFIAISITRTEIINIRPVRQRKLPERVQRLLSAFKNDSLYGKCSSFMKSTLETLCEEYNSQINESLIRDLLFENLILEKTVTVDPSHFIRRERLQLSEFTTRILLDHTNGRINYQPNFSVDPNRDQFGPYSVEIKDKNDNHLVLLSFQSRIASWIFLHALLSLFQSTKASLSLPSLYAIAVKKERTQNWKQTKVVFDQSERGFTIGDSFYSFGTVFSILVSVDSIIPLQYCVKINAQFSSDQPRLIYLTHNQQHIVLPMNGNNSAVQHSPVIIDFNKEDAYDLVHSTSFSTVRNAEGGDNRLIKSTGTFSENNYIEVMEVHPETLVLLKGKSVLITKEEDKSTLSKSSASFDRQNSRKVDLESITLNESCVFFIESVALTSPVKFDLANATVIVEVQNGIRSLLLGKQDEFRYESREQVEIADCLTFQQAKCIQLIIAVKDEILQFQNQIGQLFLPIQDISEESQLFEYAVISNTTNLDIKLEVRCRQLVRKVDTNVAQIKISGDIIESTIYNNQWFGESVAPSSPDVYEEIVLTPLPHYLEVQLLPRLPIIDSASYSVIAPPTPASSDLRSTELVIDVYEQEVRRAVSALWSDPESKHEFSDFKVSQIYNFQSLATAAAPKGFEWVEGSSWTLDVTEKGEDGWSYGFSMDHLLSNHGSAQLNIKLTALARRRKWSRKVRLIQSDKGNNTKPLEKSKVLDNFGSYVPSNKLIAQSGARNDRGGPNLNESSEDEGNNDHSLISTAPHDAWQRRIYSPKSVLSTAKERLKQYGLVLVPYQQILRVAVLTPSICVIRAFVHSYDVDYQADVLKKEVLFFISNCYAAELCALIEDRMQFSSYRRELKKVGIDGAKQSGPEKPNTKNDRDLSADVRNQLNDELARSENLIKSRMTLHYQTLKEGQDSPAPNRPKADHYYLPLTKVEKDRPLRVKFYLSLLIDVVQRNIAYSKGSSSAGNSSLEEEDVIATLEATFQKHNIYNYSFDELQSLFKVYLQQAKQQLNSIILSLGELGDLSAAANSPSIRLIEMVINTFLGEIIGLFAPYLSSPDKMSQRWNIDEILKLLLLVVQYDNDLQLFVDGYLRNYNYSTEPQMTLSNYYGKENYRKLFADFITCQVNTMKDIIMNQWQVYITEWLKVDRSAKLDANVDSDTLETAFITQLLRRIKGSYLNLLTVFDQAMQGNRSRTRETSNLHEIEHHENSNTHLQEVVSTLELSYSTIVLSIAKLHYEELLKVHSSTSSTPAIEIITAASRILNNVNYLLNYTNEWVLIPNKAGGHIYERSVKEILASLTHIQLLSAEKLSSLYFEAIFPSTSLHSSVLITNSTSGTGKDRSFQVMWNTSNPAYLEAWKLYLKEHPSSKRGFLIGEVLFSTVSGGLGADWYTGHLEKFKICISTLTAASSIELYHLLVEKYLLLWYHQLIVLASSPINDVRGDHASFTKLLISLQVDGEFLLTYFYILGKLVGVLNSSDRVDERITVHQLLSQLGTKPTLARLTRDSFHIFHTVLSLISIDWKTAKKESVAELLDEEIQTIFAKVSDQFAHAIVSALGVVLAIHGVQKYAVRRNSIGDTGSAAVNTVKRSIFGFGAITTPTKTYVEPVKSPTTVQSITYTPNESDLIDYLEGRIETLKNDLNEEWNQQTLKSQSSRQTFVPQKYYISQITTLQDCQKQLTSASLDVLSSQPVATRRLSANNHTQSNNTITISNIQAFNLLYFSKYWSYSALEPKIKIICEYFNYNDFLKIRQEQETSIPDHRISASIHDDKQYSWQNESFTFTIPHKTYDVITITLELYYQMSPQTFKLLGKHAFTCTSYNPYSRRNHFVNIDFVDDPSFKFLNTAIEKANEEQRPLTQLAFTVTSIVSAC